MTSLTSSTSRPLSTPISRTWRTDTACRQTSSSRSSRPSHRSTRAPSPADAPAGSFSSDDDRVPAPGEAPRSRRGLAGAGEPSDAYAVDRSPTDLRLPDARLGPGSRKLPLERERLLLGAECSHLDREGAVPRRRPRRGTADHAQTDGNDPRPGRSKEPCGAIGEVEDA